MKFYGDGKKFHQHHTRPTNCPALPKYKEDNERS